MLLLAAAWLAHGEDLPIVPMPASVARCEGAFELSAHTALVAASPQARRAARHFAGLAMRSHGLSLGVASGTARDHAVAFIADAKSGLGDEGYRLQARAAGVTIVAANAAGLMHGAATLWQMLAGERDHVRVPCASVEDAPRFAWRGVMLDSARHFQSPPFIRRFIDAMALEKLNVLHWHLTDDQAWRIEIRKYPELTRVGAWRVPAGPAAKADIDPATHKPRRYGGFYTQQDVREIVAYAAERGITVVPEIEMPGHALAAIVARPSLAAIADPPRQVSADWGIFPDAYSLEDGTFRFLEDVLTEVMALFPGKYIHVGGDEVQKQQWLQSARGQALMKEMNTTDPERLQGYFTQRIGRFLDSHGRRLVGWDEVLAPGLPKSSVVMSWRGTDGALAAAKAGYDTVIAAHPTFYFDNRQGSSPDEPPGRAPVVSLEDVYRAEPMPQSLSPSERAHLLGVEGTVFTEHIRTEERVGWMTFPRAAAVAELGWSQPSKRDYASFLKRVGAQRPLFEAIGMPYAKTAFVKPAPRAGTRRMSQQLELCTDIIGLNLEDDAPIAGPRSVFLVDIENPCWIARAVDLDHVHSIVAAVGQVPFNFQIGDEAGKITFPEPATAEGELQVRLGAKCDGPLVASLPLAPATHSYAVTVLPKGELAGSGVRDLCLRFAQRGLDPLWAIDWVDFPVEAKP